MLDENGVVVDDVKVASRILRLIRLIKISRSRFVFLNWQGTLKEFRCWDTHSRPGEKNSQF